ncbi:AMP-binding protein [Streptomyces sp. NPDC020800]|uniref:AMP-binding protein n=1 Tax=Streptomyces sp. NPDC020800 TaxID=3365092 RepID=UPI00378AF936
MTRSAPGALPVLDALPAPDGARHSLLVERVLTAAALRPLAPAVRGPRAVLGYRDLSDLVHAWTARLNGSGLPAGTVAALEVTDPTYLAPAHLAVRAAGLVPMLLDPHLPPARRDALLETGRPGLVIGVSEDLACRPGVPDPRVLPPDAGYLGFTSGTQGAPKGIVSNEAGVSHFVSWEAAALGLRPGTPVALISPPSFEVVFRELFLTLTTGAELVVAPPAVRADPSAVLPWLAEQDVEVLHAVPSLAARWLAAAPGRQLNRLRWTLFAGEPLHAAQVAAWRESAPHTEVVNLYGPSETTLAKFWYQVPAEPTAGIQPVGQPLPGTRLRRLSPASNSPQEQAPVGDEVFRIGIATPHGSFGYLEGTGTPTDHASLRRQAGETEFDSQDLGRLDPDGNLVVTGRRDSRVKRRGVFVDLGLIEALATREPSVRLACCVQAGPERGGAVVLVVESADPGTAARLTRELRRRLGPEAPEDVVAVASLPLSPNGKIDRRTITDRITTGTLRATGQPREGC